MSRRHGFIATYVRGCRCEECREAASGYNKERRAPAEFPYPLVLHDWHDQALCRTESHPTDLFFPDGPGQKNWKPALKVCRACPVIDACLQYALDYREMHGVWGGKTPRQRQHILEKWRSGVAS